ncbi:MAG TPA: histidine phosphatase family protein [Gaiellaceae bacterium]|nr:histidine phosphatase family protein [Gaiellaceae bacterium]
MLVVLARHAHSQLNVEGRINGDPSVPVHITEDGKTQARQLGLQLANVPFDVCLHTRFIRTLETAEIVMAGRAVPMEVEPLFDDIDVGDLEGETIDDYHAWKAKHTRSDPFPGGESLDDAARRYADGFRKLLASGRSNALVVCHEIPIRYALNAAAGSDSLDGPAHAIANAAPYLFDGPSLARAAERIETLSRSS